MSRLRSIIVEYDDGSLIPTSMAANLTDKEMLDYFAVGKTFNIGSMKDKIAKVVSATIVRRKYVEFYCRGEMFIVDEEGRISQREFFDKGGDFSGQWKLRGIAKKWNRNSIDVRFAEIWEDPRKMYGGYVFDIDHGSHRMWGGRYNGKIPRVEFARHVEV